MCTFVVIIAVIIYIYVSALFVRLCSLLYPFVDLKQYLTNASGTRIIAQKLDYECVPLALFRSLSRIGAYLAVVLCSCSHFVSSFLTRIYVAQYIRSAVNVCRLRSIPSSMISFHLPVQFHCRSVAKITLIWIKFAKPRRLVSIDQKTLPRPAPAGSL